MSGACCIMCTLDRFRREILSLLLVLMSYSVAKDITLGNHKGRVGQVPNWAISQGPQQSVQRSFFYSWLSSLELGLNLCSSSYGTFNFIFFFFYVYWHPGLSHLFLNNIQIYQAWRLLFVVYCRNIFCCLHFVSFFIILNLCFFLF